MSACWMISCQSRGACYVMDRGYIHFARLYRLTLSAAFFVVRARKNMQYRRRYSHRVDKTTGLRSDQTIVLTGHDSAHDYPAPARLIRYWDEQQNLRLRFLTNNFLLPALTIAQLYKRRWDVGIVLQVDQTTPPHQEVLRHIGQRSQDADLGRRDRLSDGGDSEETARHRGQSLQNSTDSQRHRFRENAHFTGVGGP